MASKVQTTAERIEPEKFSHVWQGAVVAGIAGGVVFGLLLQFGGLMPVIASLYGLEGVTAGWVAHIFHSVVFALVFAGVVNQTSLRRYAEKTPTSTLLGAAYGFLLWVAAAGVVMPLWLGVLGLDAPAIPNLDPMSLVGHLAYGAVLGAVYAVAIRR